MSGVSIMALGMTAFAAPVFAQDAAPAAQGAAQAPTKPDDTVVVVTGQRAQLKNAQKIKKDSDVIVDSVTAVDIGALPDRSVAEALQRVSGITIQRAATPNDPIRETAEAGGVEIRGLSWVRSETNGRDIFSAKDGRTLSWGDVSSDMLAGVDVFKNPSADMIEGGVGGTVNLRTRLPFDTKSYVAAFTADDTYGDLQKTHHGSASFLLSDRWHTSFGDIGALLNYSQVDEGNMTNVIGVDRYNALTTTSGKSVLVPNTMGWRTIDWNQKRNAVSVALQWRPTQDMEFTLTAFNAKATPKGTEYNTGFYNDNGEISAQSNVDSYTYDSNGLFVRGTIPLASITSNTRYSIEHNETTDISLHGRWDVSDRLTVTGDVQYVKSTHDQVDMTAFLQIRDRPTATIDISGNVPKLTITSPNQTSVQSEYWWAAAMDHLEKTDGKEVAARLDGVYHVDHGWLQDVKFGVRTTDKDYNARMTGYNWSLLSAQYWGGGTPVYIDGTNSTLQGFSNFMHGNVPVPGNIWFPAASVVNQGTAHAYDVLKSTETAGWGWTPLSSDWSQYAASGGLNTQNEKTTAAYASAKFKGDTHLFGDSKTVDGSLGVRVVQTKETGDSYIVVTSPVVTGTCTANCTVYNQAVTFGSGTFAYGGKSNYTDVLPSLNVRLKWDDKLQFRFAASEGMVRPEMAWLTPYSSLGYSFVTSATGTNQFAIVSATGTGTGGTPTLKPIMAAQYDISVEDYFSPTASLTFDLFDKDLTHYIFTQTETENYTHNGVTLPFQVQRYVNGSDKGHVKGFEIAYQQFYDMLPSFWSGFGLQANYTHLAMSGGRNSVQDVTNSNQITGSQQSSLPLEGMSPDSGNLALMYEKYGISARLAYNWRSKFLYTTSAANVNRPLWSDAYGQLDGSVFYTVDKHFKIGLQATNISNALTRQLVSSDLSKPLVTQFYSAIESDRRISLVLRGSF
jgi:TonB-dependent receptor